MPGFRSMLASRQRKVNSLLCVGLDPDPQKLPYDLMVDFSTEGVDAFLADKNPCPHNPTYRAITAACLSWMLGVVNATAPVASLFKLQSAHWEALPGGRASLWRIVWYIREHYPDIPIFLDCKRGDIGATQRRYAFAHLGIDGVDGMNFSPYMGMDCASALAQEYPNKAIVGLCRTSNPSAWGIQDLLLPNGRRLYEYIAEQSLQWFDQLGITGNAGLVMGAAHKTTDLLQCRHWSEEQLPAGDVFVDHLTNVRNVVGNRLWLLIPGIGSQQGFAQETVAAAWIGHGSICVNSSSAISNASRAARWSSAALGVAETTRDLLNAGIPT